MIFTWFGNRRKRLQQRPLEPRWRQWIADNVWHWHVLDDSQRRRLAGLVNIFLAEKNFEGCDGLVLSDEIKITIASAACLLLLGFEDQYCFDRVRSILVFPRPTAQRRFSQTDGVVNEFQFLSGMAQHGGPILLSWKDVRRDCADPRRVNNVVLHEFAHHIDGLDGAMEGQPPFATPQLQSRWNEVAAAELKALRVAIQEGRPSVLDPYGGHSPAEFFAVATEAFYCDGLNLFASHADLYGLLSVLYRLETKDWFAPA